MTEQKSYDQEIMDEMRQLAERASSKIRALSELKNVYAMNATERNAIVVSVTTEDSREQVKEALFDWVHNDDVYLTHLASTERFLNEVCVEMGILRQKVQAFAQQAGWELDQAKTACADALARTREHPQNNPNIRRQVWEMTGGECFYCRSPLKHPTDAPAGDLLGGVPSMHVDHIVPKDAGGPDHICNYVPACQSCNSTKSAKPFVEFYEAVVGMKRDGLKVVGAAE